MLRTLLSSILVVLTASVLCSAENEPSDQDKIQGSWKCIKLEVRGNSAPKELVEKGKYVFSEKKLTIWDGQNKLQESEFSLDTEKEPKEIDLVASDGPQKGKKMYGFYRIKDDVLTLCIGEERPKEFSGAGQAGFLEFQRIKENVKK